VAAENVRENLLGDKLMGEAAVQAMGTAGIVDVETTGLDPRRDEIIELSFVLFSYDKATGRIGTVLEEYCGQREPTCPISPGAAAVHGLTRPALQGAALDNVCIQRLFAAAEFIVAHNAAFDRGFLVGLYPQLRTKPFVCSMRCINWYGEGSPSRGLQHLLARHGISAGRAHRAGDDTHGLLQLLSCDDKNGVPYFRYLLRG